MTITKPQLETRTADGELEQVARCGMRRPRPSRRLVAGFVISVALHVLAAMTLSAAPPEAPASGAMMIAMTFAAPEETAEAGSGAGMIPDPTPLELPERKPEPAKKLKAEAAKALPKHVSRKPDPKPEREQKIAVTKKAAKEKARPKPTRKTAQQKPKKKTKPRKIKTAKTGSRPPSTAMRPKRVRAASKATAPLKAEKMRDRPRESAVLTPGIAAGGAGGKSFPMMSQVKFARRPSPAHYPRLSRDRQEEGTVVVRALVLVTGLPSRVSVHRSSGYSRLDAAARKAVGGWRFVPAKRGGQPTPAWVEIPVSFRIQ